jgi:hypothetical protein
MDDRCCGCERVDCRRLKKSLQPDCAELRRTAIRQRAILRTDSSIPDDEDDWTGKYPVELIGWLYDIVNSLEWRVSPLTVLETETRYPGLFDDLSIESWQRKLIADMVKGKSGDD